MRIILCTITLCLSIALSGQEKTVYSRVNVDLTSGDPGTFARGGFDTEHGIYLPQRLYIGDMASWEIEQVRSMDFDLKILIKDVSEYYAKQRKQRSTLTCQRYNYPYAVPENFSYGSMGGYFTYSEIIDQLDLMALYYPELITSREQVGGELTHQGRKLEWVRISDNASADEDEPEILYTALHHAREPMSMMQMIYFMWYLLENYESDPEIAYLVENTELYFIPCVNPDGYLYNEQVHPDGGGNWRKNMRDNNGDGTFSEKEDGVDLNRNYSFQWAADDEGSSAVRGSATYRGEEPFSEPETRAVRDFVAEHNFVFALNYHSFGNFLLYPWGFSGTANPDSITYVNYGELLSAKSGFEAGTPIETLGYLANGEASDWMYGKHDIMAFTPELGDADWGFWPPQTEIIDLCNAGLYKNITLAHLAHRYAVATELSSGYFTGRAGSIDIRVKRYGRETGTMALSVESLSPELEITGWLKEVGLENFKEELYSFEYVLAPEAEQGERYSFVIRLDNGDFETTDTLSNVFATRDLVFEAKGESMENWDVGPGSTWGLTDEEATSGQLALADSPFGLYSQNSVNEMVTSNPVDLTDALSAELRFSAKWEIEPVIDYAYVEVSTDGENYTMLCGEYATAGSIFQRTGEPIYDGFQSEWIEERIDISEYVGEQIYVRFGLVSDGYLEFDGIYIDDIEIITQSVDEVTTNTIDLDTDRFAFRQFPNPAGDVVYVDALNSDPSAMNMTLLVHNSLGQLVYRQDDLVPEQLVTIHTSAWTSGLYLTSLMVDGKLVSTQKLTIGH